MYRTLLTATALIALAGCRENPEPTNNVAANVAAPSFEPNAPSAKPDAPAAKPNLLGAPVSGEQAKKLMHDRHEGMEDIGDAFKATARWAKSDNPNVADVHEDAAIIARLAPLASGWYPPGTGPDVGKTRAKAEIWQKPEDFAAKMKTFQAEVRKFNAAAHGDDAAAVIAAQGELGKTCKACHDDYRAPEDEHGSD